MTYHELLTVAEDAARIAGDHALKHLGRAKAEFKQQNHIVTDLDRQCQQLIIDHIRTHHPGHGFIGEESQTSSFLKNPPAPDNDIWWVIDPIDGTRNFARALPQFAVCVAVMQDGWPIVGVIYDPNTKMIFSAQKGKNATCNGKPIRCRDEPLDSNSQIAIPNRFPISFSSSIQTLMAQYNCMNLGAGALHYAYVAQGAYAAAFTCKAKLWDVAAGCLIAQSAHALITDLQGNPRFPIDCSKYQGEAVPVLIASQKSQNTLLQTLQTTMAHNP